MRRPIGFYPWAGTRVGRRGFVGVSASARFERAAFAFLALCWLAYVLEPLFR